MKVIHILNELKFSGAEIMYETAAENFKNFGCELYVVNTAINLGEYTPFFEKAGYTVLHWPFLNGFFSKIKYIKKTIKFLKEEKIDVVHIHYSGQRLLMAFCAWRAECKSIYTFHNVFSSNWYSYYYHIVQRWIIKNIFNCTFQTISDSVYLNEKIKYKNDTIKVYNWYNYKKYFPADKGEKEAKRKDLNITKESLVIISIGGCSEIKRHEDIIKTIALLKERNLDVFYLHLGEGHTLDYEKTLAEELNVSNNIRFIKNNNIVRDYLIASDIYLMTSKFEGISLTTIEAMACKIPSILYNVPGLKDFNTEQECAVLIEENIETLADTILELSQNGEKKQKLIHNGYEMVSSKFNMNTNSKKIFNLYQK